MTWIRRLTLPVGIAAALLVGAAPAGATVSVGLNKPAQRLEITDLTGANDVLSIHPSGDNYLISSGQPLTFGQGCVDAGPPDGKFRAFCASSPDLRGFLVTLGAGNDDWTDLRTNRLGDTFPSPNTVNGGLGNDAIRGGIDDEVLNGAEGNDQVFAGGGSDTLAGGAGDDSLSDDDSPARKSADTFSGGSGADTFQIKGGGDVVNGEAGDDLILEEDLSQLPDTIDGGPDTDRWVLERSTGVTIRDGETSTSVFHDSPFKNGAELEDTLGNIEILDGTNLPDVINGALSTGKTQRTYNGRGGADVLVGRAGADQVIGGNGRDILYGRDGDDALDAKEGEPVAVPDELIDCGPGAADSASIDLLDPAATGCETVARSAIGEGPHVRIGAVRRVRSRTHAVSLRCPRKLKHRCKGALELALTRRGLRRAKGQRYSIKAGRSRTVRVLLTRRDARRLRTRRSSSGFVRSVEKGDVAGKKTTLALKRLKRR
jgi:hypothetical protein